MIRLPDAYSLLTMTLVTLETDPPHEISCLSDRKATMRRESGARLPLSRVHTFQRHDAGRPHVSPFVPRQHCYWRPRRVATATPHEISAPRVKPCGLLLVVAFWSGGANAPRPC